MRICVLTRPLHYYHSCVDTLAGVASSAAVAVPDEKMGEAVGVFISKQSTDPESAAALTPASVRAHIKEHLSGQSAPDWVWFLNEDGIAKDWPTTASGKVLKTTLRQWAKTLSESNIGRAKKSA
jgi:acyl-CoA synthetase (AMP-forming)/AMP-acid ligase II